MTVYRFIGDGPWLYTQRDGKFYPLTLAESDRYETAKAAGQSRIVDLEWDEGQVRGIPGVAA